MIGLLGVAAVVLASFPPFVSLRARRRLAALARSPFPPHCPPATAVVPCRGEQEGFADNVRAILAQDYPDLEILFAVPDEEDPACRALRGLLRGDPRARLVVAGPHPPVCAQKLHAQLRALAEARAASEVLVFLDADIRPPAGFLRQLVAPLADPGVGAATGFRFYLPGDLWTTLRSAWNAGGIAFVADPATAYAWGGAMAVRREVFERLGIASIWSRALSDDLTLSRAVRRAGLGIAFNPRCLVPCPERCDRRGLLEWTNRQTLIARVYHPAMWWGVGLVHGLGNLLLLAGAALLLAGKGTGALPLLAFPLGEAGAAALLAAALARLPQVGEAVRRHRARYVLLAPLASMLAAWNTLRSLGRRRLRWRGTLYELRAPLEVRVVSEREP